MAYIYIIENFEAGTYKIGFTKCKTIKRLKQLQTGNHSELEVIHTFETNHNRKLETCIHNLYGSKRLKGEWFDLDNDDIDNIKKFMIKHEENLDSLVDKDEDIYLQRIGKK